MSANAIDTSGPKGFGEQLGQECVKLAKGIEMTTPARPSIQGRVDRFHFSTRIDLNNPAVMLAY